MPMRKMMSIVFLLLVLLISLGVSVYMNSVSSLKEGADGNDSTETEEETGLVDGDVPPVTEGEVPPVTDESKPAATGDESTFDVSPMEGSCTETMTNYK